MYIIVKKYFFLNFHTERKFRLNQLGHKEKKIYDYAEIGWMRLRLEYIRMIEKQFSNHAIAIQYLI